MKEAYVEFLNNLFANHRIDNPGNVHEIRKYFKENNLSATEKVCGWSKKGKCRKETWWWDYSINDVIMEKRRLWKTGKNCGSKEDYAKAKKLLNVLHLLPKERPWMTNSVIKMMLPSFVKPGGLGNKIKILMVKNV